MALSNLLGETPCHSSGVRLVTRDGRDIWEGSVGEGLTGPSKESGDSEVNTRSEAEIRKVAGPLSSEVCTKDWVRFGCPQSMFN